LRDSSNSLQRVSFFRGKLTFYQTRKNRISIDKLILLSKAKGIKAKSRVADLGAGFGFLSISLAKKYGVQVYALELDQLMYELLLKNIETNSLRELVKPVNIDIRETKELSDLGFFDVVVSNPPFYPENFSPEPNPYDFELLANLRDFIKASSLLLRDGGYVNLLIPSFRLGEALLLMNSYNLHPLELTNFESGLDGRVYDYSSRYHRDVRPTPALPISRHPIS
jgi:tRNA1(Val) A37 N6-methylase TrmN6